MGSDIAADFLADVRMQADDHHLVPAAMVYPLLAAVERAQELADRWEQEAGRLQHVAREQAARGTGAGRRGATGGLAVAHIDCAKALREAITTELAKGEGGTDG